jgi:hypothetical protein
MVSKKRTRGSPRTSNRLQRKRGIPHSHIWDQVEDKPAVYPPDPDLLTDYINEAWPSGLFDGGELNIVGGTNVEIIAGAGVVIDSYTDPLAIPFKQTLSWDTQDEAITAAPAVAGSFVFILMADGAVPGPVAGTNLGVLTQIATQPTAAQVRDNIFIGFVIHNGDEWGEVSSPNVANNAAHMLSEWINQIAGPTFIKSGGAVTEAASFTLDRAAGAVWERNRNWHVDRKNPHVENFLAQPGFQWRYVNRDFTDVSALTNTVDPTQYDDGGTVSPMPLPANAASVQRLYVDPRDNYWVLWGQYTYDNYLAASSSIGADSAGTVLPFVLDAGSLLLGYIVCERGKTDWDADEARFVSAAAGGTGGAGASVTAYLGLTDTNADYVGHKTKVPAVDVAESQLVFEPRMDWKGSWAAGTFYTQNVVVDSSWTMVANKETTDRPAPQPDGTPAYTLPTLPVWAFPQHTGSVFSGISVTVPAGELWRVLKYRVWVADVSPNAHYQAIIYRVSDGAFEVLSSFDGDVLGTPGWLELTVPPAFIVEGDNFILVLHSENSAGTTDYNHPWVYTGSSQTDADPGLGNINHNNQQNALRINEEDDDGVSRISELDGVVPGTNIRVVDEGDLNAYYEYEVLNTTDNGTWRLFDVTLVDTGSSGGPGALARCQVYFEVPIAAPTEYVTESGSYAGNPNIQGYLSLDTITGGSFSTTGYGADVELQQYLVSPDWDFMAFSD